MRGKIIPFGYADGGTTSLERLMADPSAILLDIRFSARSRIPAFNKPALQARFHSRYIHMPELGNINYNHRDAGIKIADPDRGIRRIVNGLDQGYTIVLMCGCKQYESCHRHTVVELLLASMPEIQVELPDIASPANTMKCLSVQQPWAWLILNGYKELENRNWTTSYRGPVLIHAGACVDTDWFDTDGFLEEDHPMRDYAPIDMPARQSLYPIKRILGMVTLIGVAEESSFHWFVGRYGLVFTDPKIFKQPIVYSGSLKLFDVEREVIAHAEVLS